MATQTMLQQRNSHKRVTKLPENQLTLQSGLTSLESKKAGFDLRRWAVGCLSAACIVAVAGCATTPAGDGLTKDSPIAAKQEVLTQRINARWDALIKGDLDTAYKFMSEASRDAYPLGVYKAKVRPGMWRSVKIDEIACAESTCWAKMVLTYDHPRMKGIQTPFTESWIIEKGNAWFVYQPSN